MKESNHSRRKNFALAAALVVAVVGAVVLFSPSRRAKLTGFFKPHAAPQGTLPEKRSAERKILYYQDPMHPSYRSDKPGIAPDCGMQLVPVYGSEAAISATSGPAAQQPVKDRGPVQISRAQEQLIGVTTARAEYRNLEKTIRTVGRVDLDETRVSNVHVKTSGWIQKVFVDYTFQHVKKGDPLFTIYSPDLLATEQEYLLALKAQRILGDSPFRDVAAGGKSLLEAARRRLSLWDLTDEQIHQLEQSGQPQREITFYAPGSGVVLERKVFPNQYVTPASELYKLADHSVVWVFASIYESELPLVSVGQRATFTTEAFPGRAIQGRVNYIQPHLMEDTRTLPVRMEFPNPDVKLKPGMYGNVEIKIFLGRRLVVPDSAVFDSGTRQLVFVVTGPGRFEPRDVKLGVRTDGYTEVLQGLKPHEAIVSSATFLIDSESQLRAALTGMSLGTGVTGIAGQPGAASGTAAPTSPQVQVNFRIDPSPPHTGKNTVRAEVRDAAGKPVDGATVKVVFFMPAMPSMGMSAMRSEASLNFIGAGQYRGDVQLQVSGTWQLTVAVDKDGKTLGAVPFAVTVQ